MRLVFVVSSTLVMDATWTTLHLAQGALDEGHAVLFTEPRSFEITAAGRLVVRAWAATGRSSSRAELATLLARGALPYRHTVLGPGDLLLLRVNPLTPAMLNFALVAQDRGIAVLNDPAGVARTRAKTWLATLPGVPRPPTIVSAHLSSIRHFVESLGTAVVIKPIHASGGRGVALLRWEDRRHLDATVDRCRENGAPVVVQAYLPSADEGEKRLFWVRGTLLGAYLRHRPPGGFHHNLHQGARPHPCAIREADRRIAESVGAHLGRNGIGIAGLDVIGDRLVEVNTLNPGGIHFAEVTAGLPTGTLARRAIRLLLDGLGTGRAPRSQEDGA